MINKENLPEKSRRAAGSQNARNTAARLGATQAVYQMRAGGHDAAHIINEYVQHRLGKPVDGHDMVVPDGILFTNIVNGVAGRYADLAGLIDAAMQSQNEGKAAKTLDSVEPLLGSIILCGAFELLAHHEFDAPIIISDYIEVTHAFYGGSESKLVNAVLDRIARAVRDGQPPGRA